MPPNRKDADLLKPSDLARLLKVARNTVMHRIATGKYKKRSAGGYTLVVMTESLREEIEAAQAA